MVDHVKVNWIDANMNKLTKIRLVYDISDLEDDKLDFANLFSSFLMKMGTNQLDCEQMNDMIQKNNLNFECKYMNYEDPN